MNQRGFTLVEMMIASTLALLVLAGTLTAGVQLQRRSILEQQAMTTQSSAMAVKDLIAAHIRRAGTGMGAARIGFGSDGSQHFGFEITSDTGLAPDEPYRTELKSDSITFYWGKLDTAVPIGGCARTDTSVCIPTGIKTTFAAPEGDSAKQVVIVNPDRPQGCVFTVTNATDGKVDLTTGSPEAPCNATGDSFWSAPGTRIMEFGSSSLRIDWSSKVPKLIQDRDGKSYVIATNVERIKFRVGILRAATDPEVMWFPGKESAHSFDKCMTDLTAKCRDFIKDYNVTNEGTDTDLRFVQAALMRRVRMVEVQLTVRSPRIDVESRRLTSGGIPEKDGQGNILDGHKRRTYTFQIAPKNFTYSGQVL